MFTQNIFCFHYSAVRLLSLQKAVQRMTQGNRSQQSQQSTAAVNAPPRRLTRNSQKTATSQNEQVPADQVPPASTSNITKDLQVVITEKDMVHPAKPKKQTAHRGKKYTGVKPANVGNRPLTLNEQKKTHTVDQENAVDCNVIEDCHIQTTDSSYGDWLIHNGYQIQKMLLWILWS